MKLINEFAKATNNCNLKIYKILIIQRKIEKKDVFANLINT